MNAPQAVSPTPAQRWQAFSKVAVQAFHDYGNWLVSISWRRFILMSVLLLAGTTLLSEMLTWEYQETYEAPVSRPAQPAKPAKPSKAERAEQAARDAERAARDKLRKSQSPQDEVHYDVQIDSNGVRITPRAPQGAASAASGAAAASGADIVLPGVSIRLPDEKSREAVREAVREAAEEARAALEEAAQDARDAIQEQRDAVQQAEEARRSLREQQTELRTRTRRIGLGDSIKDLALIFVLASALLKITYKGRVQAEVKAAQATETAEAESLRRQVVEARMAAMQAQVEPHFLFNTLASIDHLIETDPPRASQMQRNLIALLRASMPTMREANANGGVRDLGREMAMIRPYLEILKVRMEERLQTRIDVPDGLLSAEFPPMMIQGLVENAIKHGLEPKAEGGSLTVKAEVVHGKLSVTVADTGLGFGRAATAGTGVGLANTRERLSLLYGKAASLTVAENQPSGTVVNITVPYRSTTPEGGHA